MPKIFLNVPYSEKDIAKKFGAKWDGEEKKWWIPSGCDLHKAFFWRKKDIQVKPRELSESEIIHAYRDIPSRFSSGEDALNKLNIKISNIQYVNGVQFKCPYCDTKSYSGFVSGFSFQKGNLINVGFDFHHALQDKNLNNKEEMIIYDFLEEALRKGKIKVIGNRLNKAN